MDEQTAVELVNIVDGELVGKDCELRRSVCTNQGVELVEDQYERDVYETPGVLVLGCPECLRALAEEI